MSRSRFPFDTSGPIVAALAALTLGLGPSTPAEAQTPTISIEAANVTEGNAVTTTATFTVRLSTTPPADSTRRYSGLNVGGALDWEGNLVFADAIKSARTLTDTSGTRNATVDSIGWPTEDFSVVVWHGIGRMDGTYALSFNGQASVQAEWGDLTLSTIAYAAATNTSTATLTFRSTDIAALNLVFTNTKRTAASPTNTGITNVRLMRPTARGATTSHPTTQVFSNPFATVARMFRGARFMDFTAVNGKLAETAWSTRMLPSRPSQAPGALESEAYGWRGKGVAWEYVIAMANEFDLDAWICVPVAADADYVTKLAQLFKYGSDGVNPYTSPQSSPVWPPLEPGRALYVEYGNEQWNFAGAFAQSPWNHERAIAEVAAEHILDYDGSTNDYAWAWRRVGKRIVEISNAFRAVFGDAAMMTTVRPVFEWQQGDAQTTATEALNFLDGYYNNAKGNFVVTPHPVHYYVYGGSGSAYYGPDNFSDSLTLDNIWTSDWNDVGNWATPQRIDASLAAAFGLKRLAYEGGPGLDNFGHSESVKEQAWNDPRMKTSIIAHHELWEDYGGDELFYYQIGGHDEQNYYQWHFVRNLHDPLSTSPKLQAITELAAQTKRQPALGTLAPATVEGNRWDVTGQGWGAPGSGSVTLTSSEMLSWVSYNFRTTTTASRSVVTTYSGSGTLDVYLNGIRVDRITVTGSGSHTSSALELAPDLYGVRLSCTAGSVTVNTVRLQ